MESLKSEIEDLENEGSELIEKLKELETKISSIRSENNTMVQFIYFVSNQRFEVLTFGLVVHQKIKVYLSESNGFN